MTPLHLAQALRILRKSPPTSIGALVAGGIGGIWGLSLARALAETYPTSPTFDPGPTLLLSLVAAVVAATAAWMLTRWCTTARDSWIKPFSPFIALLPSAIYIFWPGVAPRVGWTLLWGSLVLMLLLVVQRALRASSPDVGLAYHQLAIVVLAGAVLALYVSTLGPTVGQADTFEFQVVSPTWGIAHPTGYPLYILSGKLFSLLPVSSVAWRINLSSAVFGVVATMLLFRILYTFTQQALVALLGSLSFACSRVFWSQAVIAEVYTLHNLFVAAVMLVLLELTTGRWCAHRSARDPIGLADTESESVGIGRTLKPLYTLALLFGLSFANHLTTALLLPALLLTLVLVRPRISRREWLIASGLFLAAIGLYLYIYFRWPMLHDGVWMSAGEFWRYITGQQFGGALHLDAWRTDPTRYQIIGRLLREPFDWPGLGLAIIGVLWLARKQWRATLVTLIIFLAYVWYALSYYVPDVSVFLLPAHLVLATWLGLGIAVVLKTVGLVAHLVSRGRRARRDELGFTLSGTVSITLFSLLPMWLLWTNYPLVDQSGKRDALVWGDRVLDLPIAADAAILADSVHIAPLYYLQRIQGRRPDLDILVLADEATYREELNARLDFGQTVYLARFLPGLEATYHLRSLGPLTEVGVEPVVQAPRLDRVTDARFDAGQAPSIETDATIELLGFAGPVPGPGGGVGFTLYWRTGAPIGDVYHVRLRLVDDQEQMWWQGDGRHPVNNYYPTPAWRSGEIVSDYHEIPPFAMDSADLSGRYDVQVGLFRPFSDQALTTDRGETWYSLTQVSPTAWTDEQGPVHPLRARFAHMRAYSAGEAQGRPGRNGDLLLVGVDLPDTVVAGTQVEVRLRWIPSGGTLNDAVPEGHLSLIWTDSKGSASEVSIVQGRGSSRFLIQAPSSPGDYSLSLSVVDRQGRVLAARCGWFARITEDCTLATVTTTDTSASAVANYDGKLLLEDAEISLPVPVLGTTPYLAPGQVMPLTLGWRGLVPMAEDYTVSVQLVGPDGRLHGQMDAWPVQGTLPTSKWSPGERIVDPYRVELSPDAPPGRYQVGVVVYLLATQTRLPVVDQTGRAIDDIAWVGALDVVQR